MEYYLAQKQNVKMTITDEAGKLVAELKGEGSPGLNSLEWDLIELQTGKEKATGRNLPYVKAGTYKVTVQAGSLTQNGTIRVKKNTAQR